MKKRFIHHRLAAVAAVCALCVVPSVAWSQAVVSGFDANTLAANDDGSTGAVPIGFELNYFGVNFNSIYVHNNGNVTLDQALSTFTPFDLTSTGRQIIAPFFADVDTRANSDPVTYGSGTFDGRPAYGVNWVNVTCFSSGSTNPVGTNSFQLILVDRSDSGAGDFDVVFNYDQILWEAGTASNGDNTCRGGSPARAGFSNGTGDPGTAFELPGSGIAGAFLDGGPNSLSENSLNSTVRGRYVFSARNGSVDPGPPPPTRVYRPVPTLQQWGILLAVLLLAAFAGRELRRRESE